MDKRQPNNSFEAAILRIDSRVAFYIYLQDLCSEFGCLWRFFQRRINKLSMRRWNTLNKHGKDVRDEFWDSPNYRN